MRMNLRHRGETGFTLVEVMVAMFITTIVMTALIYAVVSSLATIQQAKQRQTATGLATQQLERMRAQTYDSVTQPNMASPCNTIAVDYTTTTGSVTTFAPPTRLVPGPVSEQLVVNCVSGKTTDQVVGNVTYHVETYVTKAPLAGTSQPFNLTSIVKWTSSVSKGQRELVQRTTTFSSAGCLSTATSPFAAPCQAYYTVRAGEALSGLTVSSTAGPDQLIEGLDAKQLQFDLAHTSANLLIEQTASGVAKAVTSSASVAKTTTSSTGGQSAGAAVDSDPSSVPNQSVTSSTTQSATALTSSGAAGTLVIRPSASDSGTAASAIQAPPTLCFNGTATGTGLATGGATALRPCAASAMQTAGTSAALTYTSPTGTALDLLTFGSAGAPSRAVAALLGTSNPNVCNTGAAVDCGHAAAYRSQGPTAFGALSFSSAPGGFDPSLGIFNVSGLTETARAEEGVGAIAPSAMTPAYTRAGQVKVWDSLASTYQTINLADFASPAAGATPVQQTWTIGPTQIGYAGGLKVTYEGTLTVQRPSVTQTPAIRTGNVVTDCKSTACVTTVNGSAGVSARITVTISDATGQLTTFATTVDLGGLTADSSYKAAANA